tara:strand:+ start:1230 stop:1394 length:165 start_codon:yes stop_codon:yes gene_type:complete
MKVGDLVRVDHVDISAAVIIKIHFGRQTAVDILTPMGIQERIWENHLEVISESG